MLHVYIYMYFNFQIKTTKYDGVLSPQSTSESSCATRTGPSPKKRKVESSSGDYTVEEVRKSDGLDRLKTQHFIELLGMMRRSIDSSHNDYEGFGDHIFGWYSVLNKVYFTCLVVDTEKKVYAPAFVCCENASTYMEKNKEKPPTMFRQFCFPPLNIFNPDHFKSLLALIKYFLWGRRPFTT